MSTEPTVTCPNCRQVIKLTESLAAPLLEATRERFEQRLAERDAELEVQKTIIAADEARKAKARLADDLVARDRRLVELEELLAVREEKLADAQKAQAEVLRKQRELDDQRRELELTIETRVESGLAAARERARSELDGELRLKLSEKEQVIAAMKAQLEEMKRRAEQGSQQLQGEVLELELEAVLASRFPHDVVSPVPKGERGGDVVQRVCGPSGRECGAILWESKRTKNWSDLWLPKLRKDQREAGADVAILVSTALPRGVESFERIDSVWVAHPRFALPLACVLRASLLELAAQRVAGQGLQTKTEQVYAYLTGARFRQRVQAMLEAFNAMDADLRAEKKAMLRQWAKRETQLSRVVEATAGMYGDLQGIAGTTLPEIDGLALPESIELVS